VIDEKRAKRRLKHRSGADRAINQVENVVTQLMPPIAKLPLLEQVDAVEDDTADLVRERPIETGGSRRRVKQFGLLVRVNCSEFINFSKT